MSVGKRIALAREALGLSKRQLSKKMDVSYQTITDWEEDNNTPRPTRFEKLAKVLKAPSEWLILGQGEYSPDDPPADTCHVMGFTDETAESYECTINEENQLVKKLDVKREWLKDIAGYEDENALSILTYHGDAMNPTIANGDILLVDHNVSEVTRGAIYVATINGELYINRFNKAPSGMVVMSSDNQFYPPYTIQESDNFEVIGRVILRLAAIRQ